MRKILIITLDGLDAKLLFSDERLENFHRLMEYGCYGRLELDEYYDKSLSAIRPFWRQVVQQGMRLILLDSQPEELPQELDLKAYQLNLERASDRIEKGDWDCIIVSSEILSCFQQDKKDTYPEYKTASDNYAELDSQIGKFLSIMGEVSNVLILSVRGTNTEQNGFFILASTVSPLGGELGGVKAVDLITTLLELGEYEVPAGIPGKSLVSGRKIQSVQENELTNDEEALLRERLSGLGYIS